MLAKDRTIKKLTVGVEHPVSKDVLQRTLEVIPLLKLLELSGKYRLQIAVIFSHSMQV